MLLMWANQKCTTIKYTAITCIWYITYLYHTSINVIQHKNDWPKVNRQILFLPNVVTHISQHFTTYNQSKQIKPKGYLIIFISKLSYNLDQTNKVEFLFIYLNVKIELKSNEIR